MIRQIIAQILFLTRIPVPLKTGFNEDDLVKGVIFAPIAGLITGSILAGAYFLLYISGLYIPAVISVIVLEIIITGGLHLDGLADTADGFFSYRPKEKVIQIMKDPHVGTNGILALIIVILMKCALLFSLNRVSLPFYLIVIPILSRMNIAWCAGLSVYAGKEKSLAKLIVESTGTRRIIINTIISCLIILAIFGMKKIILTISLVLIATGFASLFSYYSRKKINGITGDVIGAVIELTEVVILISLLVFETVPQLRSLLL